MVPTSRIPGKIAGGVFYWVKSQGIFGERGRLEKLANRVKFEFEFRRKHGQWCQALNILTYCNHKHLLVEYSWEVFFI